MVAAHCVAAAPVQAAAAAAARPPPCRSPAAARTLQARSRPWAPQPSQQRQQQQQLQQQQQRQCQQQQARRGRRPWWLAAASSSGNGASAAGTEAEDPLAGEPTPEELAEAEALLKDFLEGMGAAGTTDRPSDMGLKDGKIPYAQAVSMVGLSSWRLAGKVCPVIEELAAQVQGVWREVLPEDQFGGLQMEERFKYLDSMDPQGAEPFAYVAIEDPPQGDPAYPRLQVENRAYWSRAFRKLHLEVAARQDGLQVLHCVMYPRLTYDLPILSMDLVASGGRVSLAIVDPCPVTPSLQLPPAYAASVRQLQEAYGMESNRAAPEWGRAIFSPLCVLLRPTDDQQVAQFLKYAIALTKMHVQVAKIVHPVTTSPGAKRRVQAIHAAHQRYCDKQLENDKTRRVLAAAFGEELAEAYMRQLMFDVEPLPEEFA